MNFNDYIKNMSIRDKVTHLLCPAIRAAYRDGADMREYCEDIFKDEGIKPGVVFFLPSDKKAISDTIEKLENKLGYPLLTAMDFETSPVAIGGTNFSTAMAISATNNKDLAYTAGEACAVEGKEVGINLTFGPVADLNLNRSNPITNIRSWGDNPDHNIPLVDSFVKGVQQNGMIATGKHFPGDGFDDRDQHICTSVNRLSADEWMNTYGKVWKSLIDGGIKAIMPGHIALPAFEIDERIIPATLSKNILTGLLREKLGFEGLIITDGLNMGGIATYTDTENCLIGAINAGADVLLFVNFLDDMSKIADILENAVKTNKITEERIDSSLYRIWKAKNDLGLFETRERIVPTNEQLKYYEKIALQICEKSITIAKNKADILPLNKEKIKSIISVNISNSDNNLKDFETQFEKEGIKVFKYGDDTENGFVCFTELPKVDAIILNFYYGPKWASSYIRPCGEKLQRVYEYIFKLKIPSIIIAHGSPYISYEFPYAETVINTYNITESNILPLYNVIFGEQEAEGISPVKIY